MDFSQTSTKSVISLFITRFAKFHTWTMRDDDCHGTSHSSVKSMYIVYSVKVDFSHPGLLVQ